MNRIIVQGVSKVFYVGARNGQHTLQKAASLFSGREPKEMLRVLENISFATHAGEIVGIIGENGSGKSTLLRIIAGIIEKDAGVVETHGTIVAAINLGAGARGQLTMEENIVFLCSLLGLTKKETRDRIEGIVEYSGLRSFLHTKWHQFSNGMKQRTVFSVVVHVNSDILLLDEVFSGGDEQFGQTGFKKIEELATNGKTILLAGHNLTTIEKSCKRVLWLDEGKIKMEGESKRVIEAYRRYKK